MPALIDTDVPSTPGVRLTMHPHCLLMSHTFFAGGGWKSAAVPQRGCSRYARSVPPPTQQGR